MARENEDGTRFYVCEERRSFIERSPGVVNTYLVACRIPTWSLAFFHQEGTRGKIKIDLETKARRELFDLSVPFDSSSRVIFCK